MGKQLTFLVFGATGQTGQHFVALALREGHKVRALVRTPEKISIQNDLLELHKGSITDELQIDELVQGTDFVVCMLGNAKLQEQSKINTAFVKTLVPAMRRQGVKRFLYQAGGLTKRYKEGLPLIPWILRNTVARFGGLIGQHEDNEAVIEYLVEQAQDVEWIVHRAGITSNGPSKGILKRSKTKIGLATFGDCAAYNYRTVMDSSAIHTYDLSFYQKQAQATRVTTPNVTNRT